MSVSYFEKPVYITLTTRSTKSVKGDPEPVILFVRYNGKAFKYSTPVKVLPGHLEKGQISYRKDKEAVEKNTFLQTQIERVKQIFIDADQRSILVDNDYLRQQLANRTQKGQKDKSDFLSFIDRHIELAKKRTNPKTGRLLSKRTIYKYQETKALLMEYARIKRLHLTFENVANSNFAHDWIAFLQSKNYTNNTIGTLNKKVKEFVNSAIKQGITNVQVLQLADIKSFEEHVEKVYLSEAELKKLREVPKLKPYQAKARDLFLIGCYTGLRISDYKQLSQANIWNGFIHIKMQKTGDNVTIPLHPVVSGILEKYDYNLPVISSQKLNDYIKEVAEAAGIKEPISITYTKGGQRTTDTKPKYKFIATHTGRRSFATNLFLSGFPSIHIMKITGHKSERAFLKYIRVTGEQAAERLRQHWQKEGF